MKAPELLKAWRTNNELSMGGAASALGTDWGTYRRWERGDSTPRIDTVLLIAEVTGVPVEAWRAEGKPLKPLKLSRRVA